MKQVLIVTDQESGRLDKLRCAAFKLFLERKHAMEGVELVSGDSGARAGQALQTLADKGVLSFAEEEGRVDVTYVPSARANRRIALSGDSFGFPAATQEKQLAAFRTSKGAIFRMPYEDGTGALEIFITDWSPCPGAGAIAIHRHHPFIAGQPRQEGSYFTGRFVRHALTGDLLPVWVADWVKPDFGTGAVLVNPAHDLADLKFGRQIGLPIRFALVPTNFDGEPATWPQAPVIKTGKTIKTGFYDGLGVHEAVEEYFRVLERRGLAERYVDYQAGALPIARLVPDEAGPFVWDARHGRFQEHGADPAGGRRVQVEAGGLLAALAAMDRQAPVVLVATVASKTAELLFLRLLHDDLYDEPLRVEEVAMVHRAQESKAEANDQVVEMAALVSSAPDQVAVLKQQIIEQVQRFLRLHQKLLDARASAAGEPDERRAKSLRKVKDDIRLGDPSRAFNQLSTFQKQLADSPSVDAGSLAAYFVLAHTLLGFELPPDISAREVWAAM